MAKDDEGVSGFRQFFGFINNSVATMNNSKIFAGFMIIILNISSKFVTIRLSKSMESYLKYTFSRNVLVFAMAWMGTRDIMTAGFITVLFALCTEYLFNEDSRFCCLTKDFRDYHIEKFENGVSEDDYNNAMKIVAKYEEQHLSDGGDEKQPINNNKKNLDNKVVVTGMYNTASGFSGV
jgi:hypothetical protein